MLNGLKQRWRTIRQGKPGRRFQEEYQRRHGAGAGGFRRIAMLLAGGAMFAAGLFFLPAPGPGTIILVLGAALLAQESLLAARAADWTELRVRRLVHWGAGAWQSASGAGKAGIVLLTLAAAGAAAYASYRLLFA